MQIPETIVMQPLRGIIVPYSLSNTGYHFSARSGGKQDSADMNYFFIVSLLMRKLQLLSIVYFISLPWDIL